MEAVSATLILIGVLLNLLGAVGLNRFDDVFARMHAATKSTTLGMALVLTGAALQMANPGDAVKMLLVIVPQLISAPVGAHMIGRAAYRAGTELSDKTAIDELAGDETHSNQADISSDVPDAGTGRAPAGEPTDEPTDS